MGKAEMLNEICQLEINMLNYRKKVYSCVQWIVGGNISVAYSERKSATFPSFVFIYILLKWFNVA